MYVLLVVGPDGLHRRPGGRNASISPNTIPYTPSPSPTRQEWLALGALMEGHYPLALSALDKANAPPAGAKEVCGP